MNLLVLGDPPGDRHVVNRLLSKPGNRVDWHGTPHDGADVDPLRYDMVIVNGGSPAGPKVSALLELAHRIRDRAPELPILVLSALTDQSGHEACGNASGHSCGVSRSEAGVWHVHCRLKQLALDEMTTLLHDRFTASPQEPITFEYQL